MKARVFAALELPAGIKQGLAETVQRLREAVPPRSVRWVRPEGIHLTLKFYGDVAEDRLPAIEAALARVAVAAQPLELAVEGLGFFPGPLRPQVIWLGLGGVRDELTYLAGAVEEASVALGFAPEDRAFRPHLTIGRVNRGLRPDDQQKLAEVVKQAADSAPVPAAFRSAFRAKSLSLMRSQLRPDGAVYTALFATPLGSSPAGAEPPASA